MPDILMWTYIPFCAHLGHKPQNIYQSETIATVVAPKLLRNGSLNALPGNRYVLNNRRIVGSEVFFAVCSEAT
jgi:hypothetical protein